MNLLNSIAKHLSSFLTFLSPKGSHPSSHDNALSPLQKRIAYRFKDEALLMLALKHKSSVDPEDTKGLLSNERLEFLGDAVLNCLVTEHLYMRYPTYSEGQLSKIKSLLVSRKILGEIAQGIDLGSYMVTGHCEQKTGGIQRTSILSNAFEALIGAIYLDGSLGAVRAILSRFLFDKIDYFVNDVCNINYKSRILELAQRDGFGIPKYPILSEQGPDHEKMFAVGIEVSGIRLGQGSGKNKKTAQQNAAYNATLRYSKEYILSQLKGAHQ